MRQNEQQLLMSLKAGEISLYDGGVLLGHVVGAVPTTWSASKSEDNHTSPEMRKLAVCV